MLLYIMIFMHIVDDFYLQGILKDLKQKSWWDNVIAKMDEKGIKHADYSSDYIVALAIHAFSWTFLVQLPMAIVYLSSYWFIMFIFNFTIHFITDDFKANLLKINLWQDQGIHLLQILITFLIFGHYIIAVI